KKELSTTLLFGFGFSVLMALIGILFTIPILDLLNVPDEVLSITCIYLRIIFLGTPFTYFYNKLSAAFKSIGDSKTPLKFLIFYSLLNGILDIILIGQLHFGIDCSAVTTIIAEIASKFLSIIYYYR